MKKETGPKKREGQPQRERGDVSYELLTLEETAAMLSKTGRRRMEENSRREKRVFHTVEHPDSLHGPAELLADIFKLLRERRFIIHLGIDWHDLIMHAKPADPNKISAAIERLRGAREGDKPAGANGNEAESARELERAIRQVNERAGCEIFSEEQIKTARFLIEATYPDFEFSEFKKFPYYAIAISENPDIEETVKEFERRNIVKGLLISQPHIEKPLEHGEKVPEEALIMAVADLGGAGIMSEEKFSEWGDREFMELYTNVAWPENVKRLAEGDTEKDGTDREGAADAMIGWLKNQPGFVLWQMLRFEKILYLLRKNGQLDGSQEKQARNVVGRFRDTIRGAFRRADEAEKKYAEIKNSAGDTAAFVYLAGIVHLPYESRP